MPQPLPSKERSLFSQVVKNYESKQYKKGIKAADQILRKVPDHGDTQAMKALILNAQNQTDEAFKLAKDALKSDMRSHICWHVYGLLYRSAKNFEESMKAYRMALRWEPESQQIQRDLAMLQVQMRDYAGYVASRTSMLQARPGWRANWTALALAQHMNGDLDGAEKTLTTYEDTLRQPPPKTDTEHQEAILYKNQIIAESGQLGRALEHLESISKRIADQQTVLELKAGYLLGLGRREEAEKIYRRLLDRNSEYRAYYEGLEAAVSSDPTDLKARHALYKEYAEKNKRGDAALRIPLDFLKGVEFTAAADSYLRRKLGKGVPSTFANLKTLYQDEDKRKTILELVEGYRSDSSLDQVFQDAVGYFLSQHYNYHVTRDLDRALAEIDKLLDKTSKSVDYLMTRARIFKHQGDLEQASAIMETARQSDEKDRYINTKAAKYQLRNDQNGDALNTMSKFTKPDAAGGPLGDLTDMQSVWFLTEDGESRLRQNHLGLALKRFHTIYNIYDIWQEDQYDFHAFSLRKGQIRAYVEMLKWEDHLRRHPYYTRAAIGAIESYLKLDTDPTLTNGSLVNGQSSDANERKKAAKKARKEAEKQAQVEHERRDAKKTAGGAGADGETKKVDPDPEGKQLVATKQPLEDAVKFLAPLLELNLDDPEAQRIGFEVSVRRRKWLPALRCLVAAHQRRPSDPFVHYGAVRFRAGLSQSGDELPAAIAEIVEEQARGIVPGPKEDLAAYNEKYLSANKSFRQQLAGIRTRQALKPSALDASVQGLVRLVSSQPATLEECIEGLRAIEEWNGSTKEYATAARSKWPTAKVFHS